MSLIRSEVLADMRKVTIALVLLLASAGAALARDPQPRCDRDIREIGGPCFTTDGMPVSETSRKGVLAARHRDLMGFVVGRDSFQEAQRVFGRATQWSTGDAASAEVKTCYVAQDRGDTVTLVLAQNAEMSLRIDEIRLIRGSIEASHHCARLDVAPEKLRTKSGLRVGMTVKEAAAILGLPTRERDGIHVYGWARNRELRPADDGYQSCLSLEGKSIETLGSGITLRIEHGVVTWLTIAYGDYVC